MALEDERDEYGSLGDLPLGDLPRSIGHERGEVDPLSPYGRAPPGSGIAKAADLARSTDITRTMRTTEIPKGAPALAYGVQSTYDARPIQGTDFQSSACKTLTWIADVVHDASFVPITFSFVVPENTIAVLRSFRYTVSPGFTNIVVEGGPCWLQSDLFINDIAVRQYNKMLLPTFMEEKFPTFVIVDERLTLKLVLSLAPTQIPPTVTLMELALIGLESLVMFEFYGNIILKSGIPKEFEIANPLGGQV